MLERSLTELRFVVTGVREGLQLTQFRFTSMELFFLKMVVRKRIQLTDSVIAVAKRMAY